MTHYYTCLKPFREVFRQGLPILTYHHLGRRPAGTRLKGLYVSRQLFARQLAELRASGMRSTSLDGVPDLLRDFKNRAVITFDDGFRSVSEHGVETLATYGFKAIQFLVSGLLGQRSEWEAANGEVLQPLMDAVQVREWINAGHEIGSHTVSHPWLTQLSPSRAREEIRASKAQLEDTFGLPVRHFCYPYGDWNRQVRELVAEAGYSTACTTDFGVNSAEEDPFTLRRLTARYRSRNWKSLWAWFRRS